MKRFPHEKYTWKNISPGLLSPPDREDVISNDDVTNLKIDLNREEDVTDFLRRI